MNPFTYGNSSILKERGRAEKGGQRARVVTFSSKCKWVIRRATMGRFSQNLNEPSDADEVESDQ